MSRWLKPLSLAAMLGVLTFALPSICRAEARGNVHLMLGQKSLSESDWEPVENQPEFGILSDWGSKDWPIHVATDLLFSQDDEEESGLDIDGKTFELALGVRKVWYGNERFRPNLGGGVSLVQAEVELEDSSFSVDDDDTGIGVWIGGGICWRIGSVFQIGAALRYSYAEVTLFGEDVKGGGLHYGLLLGFGWPSE